jgi:hypothetical protein
MLLRNMQTTLREWSKEQSRVVSRELNDLRKHLEEVKSRFVVCQADVRAITDCMNELLYQEEMMWLQHGCCSTSPTSWLLSHKVGVQRKGPSRDQCIGRSRVSSQPP